MGRQKASAPNDSKHSRQKLLHQMIANIPQLQSAPNFYLDTILIR